MPAVVVDTDVVSYLFKRDTRARRYRGHLGQGAHRLVYDVGGAGSLGRPGALGPQRRDALERFLQGFRAYHSDRTLCRLWAEVLDHARRRGRPIEVADAWVAATAVALDVPLVTHNPADYAGVPGLTVLSEATA